MAYNVLKGNVEGSVDQHGDQEIDGVKVFKNTVSASVFWDTDAQSPCATMKDVAITKINGGTKGAFLLFEDDKTVKTHHNLTYEDGTLYARRIKALTFVGSAGGLDNIPADKFNAKIGAQFIEHSHGLHNVRGSLQVKPGDCVTVDEAGISIKVNNACGLSLKSGKLTIDPSKADPINRQGQNLSDNDLLLVSDISSNETKNTSLKNLYDGYLKLKVPHAAGPVGAVQIKGNTEFQSSAKLTYDISTNSLNVDGKVKTNSVEIDKKLVCQGAVYHNITKTSDKEYKVKDSDHTILCDSSNNKVKVRLPAPCNSTGRILIIKKANSDQYKLNSNVVEIHCEESKIDISDSVILKSNYSTRTLQSDGEAWYVINKIG
jgi:hypothetical protein